MPLNGTISAIVSKNALEKGSQSSLMNAMTNANEEAKKSDLKSGKKATNKKK